jgi:heme/copper-type cytochrome/quinol oxidase subunit 2
MNRNLIARLLLTFVLIGGALMSFGLDWRENHLLNPLWHPHARYHAAILLFLFAGVAGVGTWLLWRPSREPDVAFTAASLPGHEPRIAGMIVYPNLIVIAAFVSLTVLGWCLPRPETHQDADSK